MSRGNGGAGGGGTRGAATEVASRTTSPLATIVLVTLMVSALTVMLRALTGPAKFTTSVPASPSMIKSMPGTSNELTVSTSCKTNGTLGTRPALSSPRLIVKLLVGFVNVSDSKVRKGKTGASVSVAPLSVSVALSMS